MNRKSNKKKHNLKKYIKLWITLLFIVTFIIFVYSRLQCDENAEIKRMYDVRSHTPQYPPPLINFIDK